MTPEQEAQLWQQLGALQATVDAVKSDLALLKAEVHHHSDPDPIGMKERVKQMGVPAGAAALIVTLFEILRMILE